MFFSKSWLLGLIRIRTGQFLRACSFQQKRISSTQFYLMTWVATSALLPLAQASCNLSSFFLLEVCSVDCGTHGVCIGGACRCEEGWTGMACDQRVCHPRCTEHGTCKDGKCECREGWNGEHCTIGRQTTGTETGTYCFLFINRRNIVIVVYCNRLFL